MLQIAWEMCLLVLGKISILYNVDKWIQKFPIWIFEGASSRRQIHVDSRRALCRPRMIRRMSKFWEVFVAVYWISFIFVLN